MPDIYISRNVRQRNFLSEIVRDKVKNYNLFRVKDKKKELKYITRDQYKILLSACNTLRDKILLALLFEGGLRSGEACGIHIEDLSQLGEGIIQIVPREDNINGARVKNYSGGSIYIPKYVVDMITEYISTRTIKSEYLFIKAKGNEGSPIDHHNVTQLFISLSKRTGINVHAHMLRHGFAVEKLSGPEHFQLFEIQAYMRHKVPTSTAIYAQFTDSEKVRRMKEFYDTHNIETEEYDYVF